LSFKNINRVLTSIYTMRKTIFEQKGISPVIGVILLVAVTVALVALATVIVFDIGSDVNETSSSAVQTSTGSNGVQVQALRNDNVEQFEVVGPDGKTDTLYGDVGDSLNIGDGAGQYLVKAILDDGSEEVIDTITVDEGSSASEVRTGTEEGSGTVSVNPEVEEATVQSIEDGFVIDETTTDANGEYTIEYSEDSEILVMIDGFDDDALTHTLYASAERSDFTDGEPIDFSFIDERVETVGGEEVLVANTVEEETASVKTIATLQELQAINTELDSDYKLVRNIDASETESWNDGEGFTPIGDWSDGDREEDEFTGSFDGQGYEIEGLTINRPDEDNIGLLGNTGDSSEIENIGMVNYNIHGNSNVGGLVGFNTDGSTVIESYATGSVTGTGEVGGLVGYNGGTVIESYAEGSVTGTEVVGGLVGFNGGTVSESYAEGSVTGDSAAVGGLVGINNFGTVSESYATGSVTSDFAAVGGLVGFNFGDVSESYATGSVSGDERVGGLVGDNEGEVSESYATGSVTGDFAAVGGLVGDNKGEVSESYATGSVTSDFAVVGGLVGNNLGDVSESYWDTESSSITSSEGGTGLSTDEMQGEDSETHMDGFDFTNTWSTVTDDYPTLQWQE